MPATDLFTGHPSHLEGSRLPGAEGWAAVLDGHRQRLRALDQLGEKAAQCSFAAHHDRSLVLAQDDEVGLLEFAEQRWRDLGQAIRDFRGTLPLVRLEDFGFSADHEDPFEANTPRLRRIGGGVEALAFADAGLSVYKFFLFREGGDVGATFAFTRGEGEWLQATAVPGSYRQLFDKLRLTHTLGMPTEIAGITPEGIVVAKQTFGEMLPEKTDVSALDPEKFISIPSRFLRTDRDHPRLAFLDGVPWLVADTHDRNVVVAADKTWRVIDLVAAPLPPEWLGQMPLFQEWIERARHDPHAGILAPANDDDL